MQMITGFNMDGNPIGPGSGKGINIFVGIDDHQMHIQIFAGSCPGGLDNERADSNVRHKMTIHDIYVNDITTGAVDSANLFAQPPKIGGQN
jgi:hypothetical protein